MSYSKSKASWEVVKAMQKSSDYLDFKRPEPSYTIPVLTKGETIELKNIIGKWYGTGTYGSDYLGQIMEVKDVDGQPEEFYLNAVGYNLLRDGKVNDTLNSFELAMVYYPQSVNTYDSYAEALIVAGRKDEALAVYRKAYELAKKTDYENLAYIKKRSCLKLFFRAAK